MVVWVKEEEKNASKHRQGKREAEEADKAEVAPGVTVVIYRPKDSPSGVDCADRET